jgi:HSP20 family protein
MSLIRYQFPTTGSWSPFDGLSTLRDEVNRLFESTLGGNGGPAALFSGWNPPLDVYQDKDNVTVRVEIAGVRKEDIDISLENGVLTISGERKQEKDSDAGETFRSERFFGRFHRSVTLPTEVDSERVAASYKDGVLAVTLPKSETAKPRQIEVNVS